MRSRLLIIGVLCAALLWTGGASAFTIMKAQSSGKELRWTSLPMKFNIEQGTLNGMSAAQCQQAIRAAYQTWANVSCSYFTASDLGLVGGGSANTGDHKNSNSFPSFWKASFPSNALGFTRTIYDPASGKILDADVFYNPNNVWSNTGAANAVDLQAVATHEIGHEMGFNHSPHTTATMYYAVGKGNTGPRSLHSDDIAAVCYSYGNGKPKPPECTSASHCAPKETCTNNTCIPGTTPKAGYGGSCKYSNDCNSKLCISFSGGGKCSQSCTSAACPGGDNCVPLSGGGKACSPGTAAKAKAMGSKCSTSGDCKSKYCVSLGGKPAVCSQKCDVAKKNCPAGFACTATAGGGGLCMVDNTPPPPPPPPPPKKKTLGQTCKNSAQCNTGLTCANTGKGLKCAKSCDRTKGITCDKGYLCATPTNSTSGACLKDTGSKPPPQPPKPPKNPPPPAKGTLGASCVNNSACNSGLCATNSQTGNNFCTRMCDPTVGCGQGFECASAGGGKHACKPAAATNPGTGPDGQDTGVGCAVAARASRLPGAWLLVLLALALAARRRSS